MILGLARIAFLLVRTKEANKTWQNKLQCSTPPSNETGTFPFERGSDVATFARESKEQSLRKTHEEEDTSGIILIFLTIYMNNNSLDINKDHHENMKYAIPEVNKEEFDKDEDEVMMFINKRNTDQDSYDENLKTKKYHHHNYQNFHFKDTKDETHENKEYDSTNLKFESRIKKTDPEFESKYEEAKDLLDQEFEDEEEEEEPEITKEHAHHQHKRSTYRARQYEDKFNKIDEQFDKLDDENYIESTEDQYNTNDYENAISNTYAKAKRYKRKAKKLYNNLQKLKAHYDKAK